MSVDLGDFIPNLMREVDPPGTVSFPNATDDEWIGSLTDGFWEARLDGLLPLNKYSCDEDGLVTPIKAGDPDIPRDLIQMVIFYAGYRILRNALRGLRTQFRASAGPVTFEYQQSANLLVEIMKDLINRRNVILLRLSDVGAVNDYYIDALTARDLSFQNQAAFWVGAGDWIPQGSLSAGGGNYG